MPRAFAIARRAAACAVVTVTATPLAAQQFPTKPVTFVVPYAAGGNVDISTRILQAGIGGTLGQPAPPGQRQAEDLGGRPARLAPADVPALGIQDKAAFAPPQNEGGIAGAQVLQP